ncbi:YVTN repeat-like/Quino protein amine dehydrogenase [Bimuria novae-zelandiae CBS 107.79]|uniref:YVTN repeat-like/Quino protein amine dehydrogenase n=1 Tax=Bimuria novae-zelandiae CBS 107.79 TaxID=1447943 RepID=A0A6A5VH36_9PLEO|nr:YVTN repeat-like/Quino protein amine dehydrogenase [Bimuria novae-zelandiae CBS 107.79]
MSVITRDDLAGEERDYQGIIWSTRMLRRDFRQKRTSMERARLHKAMCQYGAPPSPISCNENFFSFRRMDKRHRPWGPHFQLRNMMAVTSRQDIYYAKRLEGIYKTDALGSEAQTIIDTSKYSTNGNICMITTLAAMDDVLIAGGFDGEYAVVDLKSMEGPLTSMNTIRDWAPGTKSYITNHVHLFNDRHTYTPQAVLSSNDYSLRVLDCATNTFRYKFPFKAAVNCSATGPDGRLRVVVGDFPETLITNAETSEVLQTLRAHEGDAFACAWADDGIHVASASQDGTIAVWDARTWKPLALLPSELSIPRVLKFSPVGSGPRVLVSAEADDYVSIINATTFENKQTFDFFGQTGGVDFTPDGQSLFVANSEYGLGGIIELERAGGWNARRMNMRVEDAYDEDAKVDWGYESDLDDDYRVLCGQAERQRWGLDLGAIDV